MKAIEAKNLSKSYRLYDKQAHRLKEALHPFRKQYSREFFALKDVSFSIDKGETVGIIGKNGSGKSTLLQLLCNIIQPSGGEIKTVGKISSLLELGTGFNPEYSGYENIFLNAAIMGLTTAEINKNLARIIDFADIGDFINQPVKTYSSGMYVRLAFAIQANVDSDILIVDEALAVGDAQFVHKCMLRFHQLQKEGKTIILVTHDASAVKTLCSRAIWLEHGVLKAVGASSLVVDQYLNAIFKNAKWKYDEVPEAIVGSNDCVDTHSVDPVAFIKTPLKYDERTGDGTFEIVNCLLLNSQNNQTSAINQNETIQIILSFRNNSKEEIEPLIGLILKDPKGIEIASTISRMEQFTYSNIKPNEMLTTSIEFKIPRLYPGPYSITPTVSYLDNSEDKIADRLVNALVFEIISSGECHTLISLDASYKVTTPTSVIENRRNREGN